MKLSFIGNGLLDTDCYPFPNQGASVQTWGLAKELAHRGHDVTIVVRGNFNGTQEIDGVTLFNIKFKGLENIFNFSYLSTPFHLTRISSVLRFSRKSLASLQKIKPNIVCIQDIFSGIFPSWYGNRKIFINHIPDGLEFFKAYSISANSFNSLMFFIKRSAQNYIMVRAERIIVLNSFIEDYLKSRGYRTVSKIPNGINSESFTSKSDGNYIIYAGRFDWNKNVLSLIEAFSNVKDFQPEFKLFLVGDGPEKAKIKLAIIKENLESRVIIFPWLPREKLLDLISNCSIFVLPSIFEAANPVVILEAMACCKPVVCKRNIGTKDIIDNGNNGYLYRNQAELSCYLKELLLNNSLRQTMGQNARKTIEQKYDFRQIADQYEKLFMDDLNYS